MSSQQDRFAEGLKKGDRQIFEELFHRYYAELCHYALRFVPDEDTAEEIVQELFFRMWEKREQVKINTSIESYLFIALRNLAMNYISSRKIHDRYRQFEAQQSKTGLEFPTDALEEEDMQRIMKQAVAMLPEKRRQIFELSRFEHLKYEEIAKKLNVSVKTVETHMSKSLSQLRKVLARFL